VPTSGGVRLFVRRLRNTGSEPSRQLLIVHGACGYGGRLEELGIAAAADGWDVVLPDLRGHGRSEGTPVFVERFSDYLDDLDAVWKHFGLSSHTTAVLGQSAGALIAARFAATSAHPPRALALLSPFLKLKLPVNPLRLAAGRVLNVLAPRTRFRSGLRPEDLSQDPLAQERCRTDPLIHRSITARWFFAMREARERALAHPEQIRQPILLLQGGADRVVDPEANEAWFRSLSVADKTWRSFPGHLHELLHEPDRAEIKRLILAWLDERIAAV
jgi:alpha-beta hydrolase superfamily lysophospholipase